RPRSWGVLYPFLGLRALVELLLEVRGPLGAPLLRALLRALVRLLGPLAGRALPADLLDAQLIGLVVGHAPERTPHRPLKPRGRPPITGESMPSSALDSRRRSRVPASPAPPLLRFQRPELPPMDEVLRYYARSEAARWYANGGPCAQELTARIESHVGGGAHC